MSKEKTFVNCWKLGRISPSSGLRRGSAVRQLLVLLSVVLLAASCNGGGGSGDVSGTGVDTPGSGFGQGGGSGGGGGGGGGGGTGGGGTGGGDDTPDGVPDDGDGGSGGGGSGGDGGGSGGGAGSNGQTDQVNLNPGTGGGTQRVVSEVVSATATTAGEGVIPVSVVNTTSFQVVSVAFDRAIAAALADPNGDLVVQLVGGPSDPQSTSAVFTNRNTNSLPYPARPFDPVVIDGLYQEGIIIVNPDTLRPVPGAFFEAQVVAKRDSTETSGVLRVNVFLVGTTAQQAEYVDAAQRAIDNVWRPIYNNIGITLDVTVTNVITGVAILPDPAVGSDFYLEQAGAARRFAVNMYIGDDIDIQSPIPGSDLEVIGAAPAIPGPAVPTRNSAVALDVTEHAGLDNTFDDAEVRVFGETMAHEAGHYLGLFHPVEYIDENRDTLVPGDTFADTAECTTDSQCIAVGTAENLMYPQPIFGVTAQQTLTTTQGLTINSQVIVD